MLIVTVESLSTKFYENLTNLRCQIVLDAMSLNLPVLSTPSKDFTERMKWQKEVGIWTSGFFERKWKTK